jgi:hypothetical protein
MLNHILDFIGEYIKSKYILWYYKPQENIRLHNIKIILLKLCCGMKSTGCIADILSTS